MKESRDTHVRPIHCLDSCVASVVVLVVLWSSHPTGVQGDVGSNPAQGNSSCFSFDIINQLINKMVSFLHSRHSFLHPRHQHCTDEAQKAETVLSAVRYSSLALQSFCFHVQIEHSTRMSHCRLQLRMLTSSLV